MPIPDRSTFESIYADQPPWDIGKPQKTLIDVADQISGSILDAGCGTGENALFLASRGHKVTGIDFLVEPINMANHTAKEWGLTATFLVMDALHLKDLPEVFDNVIDSGPRRISRQEIENAFADGWKIESIEQARFEVRPDLKDISFSEGGPKAWFVVAKRG